MQKYFFILMLSVLAFSGNQTPDEKEFTGFEIKGTISGAEGQTIYLQKYTDGKMVSLDSTVIDSASQFTFTGEVEVAVAEYLTIQDKRKELFVENSKITVTGSFDDFENLEIKGSKAQDELEAFNDAVKPYQVKIDTLYAKYKRATDAGDKAAIDTINKEYDVLDAEKSTFVLDYVKKNGKSIVSPYIVRSELVYRLSLTELNEVVASMDSVVYKSEYYIFLKERTEILAKVEVGQYFTDFTQNDSLGKAFSLSQLKGKVILVDFWASWCGPCRRANPDVVAIYKEFHKKGFEVLGVSFDEDRANWLKAIKDDGLIWNHVSDLKGWGNAAGKLYGVMSIPHTVLIDQNGKIVAKNMTKEELKEQLVNLLKK